MTSENEKSLTTRLLPAWIAGFAFLLWGGGLLLLGNALSGPLSALQWLGYSTVLIILPLAVTLAFGRWAGAAFEMGEPAKGRLLAAIPLILLAVAALLAWNFG